MLVDTPSAAPPKKGGGAFKFIMVILVILFFIGALVVGGVMYAGYRIKKKADEIQDAYKKGDSDKLIGALTGQGGEAQKLPEWKSASGSIVGAPSSKVPLLPGLTVVTAINQRLQGDYESIKLIDTVSPAEMHLHYSAQIPPPDLGPLFNDQGQKKEAPRKVGCGRTVLRADLDSAHDYQENFCGSGSEEQFPGTTAISISREALAQLKLNGETKFSYRLGGLGGMLKSLKGLVNQTQSGQPNNNPGIPDLGAEQAVTCLLKRASADDVAFPVLLNNRHVELPALHAVCKPDDGSESHFYFLDDLDNPLALAWQIGSMGRLQVIKIERPEATEPAGGGGQIEQQLETKGRVQIYGIYFDFASDVLRPESETVLKEIAGIMTTHADWQLSIEGHTDNIGGDQYNLDLSNRRAAAVKQALVDRYQIAPDRLTTQGFGASRPVDTNDTLEGRAQNRRVELVKK